MREYKISDYAEIRKWFWDRNMHFPRPDDLPANGFIEPGVAAGFLVWTDTATAVLDFVISNPEAKLMQRGRAVSLIIDQLIEKAKDIGFKRVKCDSQIRTIKRIAHSLEFKDLGYHQVFIKEI